MIVHIEVDDVDDRCKQVVITRRSRAPVLSKIGEHVDMVAEQIEAGLSERNGECPLSQPIPLQRGWEMTADLHGSL